MAQPVEPMDIDGSVCDFDDKENSFHHNNALSRTPCTEKGYEELDVSELNMKLRYSMTPASSPMSKSYTANCVDNRNANPDLTLNCENGNMSRSLHSTLKNELSAKPQKVLPLQVLSTDQGQIVDGNRTALRPLDSTATLDSNNITVTVSSPNDIDENISLPSSSSSLAHTPEATTPTKELPKGDASPIMRGLKSVLNMFRPSQSPIPPEDELKPEVLSPPIVISPDHSTSSQVVSASTPLTGQKTKDPLGRRNSPNRDSLVFNDEIEKDLEWKDDSTIIFSKEKIPIHKLFYQQPKSSSKAPQAVVMDGGNQKLDTSVEYMDISYNDSAILGKTILNPSDNLNKSNATNAESDSEFLDCESTFSKNESQLEESFKPVEEETTPRKELTSENLNDTTETLGEKSGNLSVDSVASTKTTTAIDGTTVAAETKEPEVVPKDELKEVINEAKENTELIAPVPVKDDLPSNYCINTIKNNTSSHNISIPENVISSLCQIPLIVDPKVLLFNIPSEPSVEYQISNADDVLNTSPTDMPLPDDDDIDNIPSIPPTSMPVNDDIQNQDKNKNNVNNIAQDKAESAVKENEQNNINAEVAENKEVPINSTVLVDSHMPELVTDLSLIQEANNTLEVSAIMSQTNTNNDTILRSIDELINEIDFNKTPDQNTAKEDVKAESLEPMDISMADVSPIDLKDKVTELCEYNLLGKYVINDNASIPEAIPKLTETKVEENTTVPDIIETLSSNNDTRIDVNIETKLETVIQIKELSEPEIISNNNSEMQTDVLKTITENKTEVHIEEIPTNYVLTQEEDNGKSESKDLVFAAQPTESEMIRNIENDIESIKHEVETIVATAMDIVAFKENNLRSEPACVTFDMADNNCEAHVKINAIQDNDLKETHESFNVQNQAVDSTVHVAKDEILLAPVNDSVLIPKVVAIPEAGLTNVEENADIISQVTEEPNSTNDTICETASVEKINVAKDDILLTPVNDSVLVPKNVAIPEAGLTNVEENADIISQVTEEPNSTNETICETASVEKIKVDQFLENAVKDAEILRHTDATVIAIQCQHPQPEADASATEDSTKVTSEPIGVTNYMEQVETEITTNEKVNVIERKLPVDIGPQILENERQDMNDSIQIKQSDQEITEKLSLQEGGDKNENLENLDEEVLASENGSPFMSVSAEVEVPEEIKQMNYEEIENPSTSEEAVSSPPSPKIVSKGYNFNFDEIEDPFATKTKIRTSPPPDNSPNQSFKPKDIESEIPKKEFNKNTRRKSQPEKRKPIHSNKKLNSTFAGKSNVNKTPQPEMLLPSTKPDISKQHSKVKHESETLRNDETVVINEIEEVAKNAHNLDLQIVTSDLTHNELAMEEDTTILTETLSEIKEDKKVTSSSEQSAYMSAGTSFSEGVETKSTFNLPEIDDPNFNPFVSKSKMRQSPPRVVDINPFALKSPPPSIDVIDPFTTKSKIATSPNTSMICEPKPEHPDSITTVNVDAEVGKTEENIEENLSVPGDDKTFSNKSDSTVKTEDADTLEGPFLEAEDFNDDKMSDFDSENIDMMQFSELPPSNEDHTEAGELFIDAEAFEFLLNQNQANAVVDSGKESLFLKFDPLFAKRLSSEGVLAALNKIQKRESTPKKIAKPQIDNTFEKSPAPGPSTMNVTNDIDISKFSNTTEDSCDDLNVTVSKPMMVVNPAVSAVVTPRNKTATPVRSNRQSLTFTSPAIAVIDRLLNMSANNSLASHDNTIAEVRRDNEADLALTQLRELLADKEISVYNLRSESKDLKDRLSNLESQMKNLEAISEERLKKINELNDELTEKTKINKSMAKVVEEYERTIASLIAEAEQDRKRHAEERIQLIKERDEQSAHLASMEVSFSDLHTKYEKSKQVILGFKANEDSYKKSIKEFEENLAKIEKNYELLKQHATSKLMHANEELQKINRSHEADVLKLNALIKRKELHITSLEETVQQKTKANEELTAICDELINKVG